MNELGVLTKPNLPPLKPKLRGVLHEYAFFISLGCGIALILAASDGQGAGGGGDLRGRRVRAARHQRPVPPRHLAPEGAALDEAT